MLEIYVLTHQIENLKIYHHLLKVIHIFQKFLQLYQMRGMHDLSLFEKVLKVNLIGSFNMLRLCVKFPMLVYRTGAYAPNGIPNADGFVDYYKMINARASNLTVLSFHLKI